MTQAPNQKARPPVGTGARTIKEHGNRITGPTGCKPHFDTDTLATLRYRLPDYLAARGVELRPQGSRLVGRCPVHDDSNPSFAAWGQHHEFCGCHPCGFSGDVFATAIWLGRASNLPEAVADVAAALGYSLPQAHPQGAPRPAQAPQWIARQPEPPFELSEADRERIHAARLAFCDAFHGGDPVIDQIAASLGLERETLRLAAWGSCGLGLANGWLCYAYPAGLKWRNPHPKTTPRFRWIVGKATQPWRMAWPSKPEVHTVYLTEGESDCMALIESGLEVPGVAACVASPGTSFPQAWAQLFTGKRVVLCFDSDPPGQAAAKKVAAMLRPYAAAVSCWKGGRT